MNHPPIEVPDTFQKLFYHTVDSYREMPRPLRINDPDKLQLVTVRTQAAQLLLRPDRWVNEMIGGVLARYQEMYGIEIYAYTFLSNHYHILLRAPRCNLWQFEQALNREIARRINFYLKREGTLWGRRYDAQIVVEDADQIEALLYIVCNATGHGLVSHPQQWPGMHSYDQLRTGKELTYRFDIYSSKEETALHTLKLSPLPALGCNSLTEQWEVLQKEIFKRLRKLHEARENKPFLGKARILKQKPFARPKKIKRSPRPACYTKSLIALHWFRKFYKQVRTTYVEASYRYRCGDLSALFPPFTFPPPAHYVPN